MLDANGMHDLPRSIVQHPPERDDELRCILSAATALGAPTHVQCVADGRSQSPADKAESDPVRTPNLESVSGNAAKYTRLARR